MSAGELQTDTLDIEAETPQKGSERSEKGSLKPVLDVIPAEAYDNPTWKGLAYFGRDLVMYGLIVTGLILVNNPFAVIALWVLSAMVISGLFIVAHDAAHGALFSSKRLNRVIGTIAMLPSWHVYEGWTLGHNRIHHGYTVREGFDFVWHPYTPEQFAAMSPLGRLRHRFEWSWFGAGAYYLREVWWHKMIVGAPPARWAKTIRRDRFIVWSFVAVASLTLGALGWASYGSVIGILWMILKVLVIPFLGFSFVIASFVHVHHIQPNIRWWKRREWTKWHGQMEGTTVLRARFGLNFFFHWIMVHVPHHVDMRIPMYNLELATDAMKEAFPGTIHDEPLRFMDFVRNTRVCRLYDFDEARWYTYRQAAKRPAAEQVTEPAAA
ncbi:unannotated protein [freshwater metagenome]|uniref:Unannotated protein n=1 Tax=freshwater metagenome TaxID=449393 RepID=A0A6J7K3E0_9ZZZZ|nr:fatty acid desaturase [Actinomycetota bacterium]